MYLKKKEIKTWSLSRYYKPGYFYLDDLGRPNKNDIKHILKIIGFDSIREFNNASKHDGAFNINKQLQEKLISIFEISKPSSFDEIMIYKGWYDLENNIKFPFELSPNVSEQSIFIRDSFIEKFYNTETSTDDYIFYIRASISYDNFLQPRKDSFNEICTLLARGKPPEIDQLTKNEFNIFKSYLFEETGNLKLVENKDFIEKLFDQVHYLPENIFLETKKLIIDQEEVCFFVEGEEEDIEISPDFF